MSRPSHASPGELGTTKSSVTLTSPYTATLSITPDMRAETLLGAEGWALGSQMCIGTSPALVPKPTNARMKTESLAYGESRPAELLKTSNERLPVWE